MFQNPKIMFTLVALIAYGSATTSYVYSQDVVVDVDCNREEEVKALLDHASIIAGKDQSIIIIARLGSRESSRQLIRGRLSVASSYLIENRGVLKSRVITAEGERVRGLGHVEVYVGGKLQIIFKMKRNKYFGSDCPPPYP